eukprot:3408020-Rhodomonas_salina.1
MFVEIQYDANWGRTALGPWLKMPRVQICFAGWPGECERNDSGLKRRIALSIGWTSRRPNTPSEVSAKRYLDAVFAEPMELCSMPCRKHEKQEYLSLIHISEPTRPRLI